MTRRTRGVTRRLRTDTPEPDGGGAPAARAKRYAACIPERGPGPGPGGAHVDRDRRWGRARSPEHDEQTGGAGSEPGVQWRMQGEARRISSQHRQLELFYGMLEEALERGALQGARVAFVRFRDALDAHITLEDQVFFPALHGLSPELGPQLTGFVREHEAMRRQLDQLQDLLAEGAVESCVRELDAFAERIADHERREERLLADLRSGTPDSS